MMKRILGGIAALFTALALTFAAGAAPAQATAVGGCGDGWICFYNWESHDSGGGSWGMRIYPDNQHNWAYGDCQTMPTSGTNFPGGSAYNKATSIVINNTPAPNAISFNAYFYDDNNCQSSYLYKPNVPLSAFTWNRLADFVNTNTNPFTTWNDAIGSFYLCSC